MSGARRGDYGALLFAAQRLTALVLAPLALVHLGLILYAVEAGLTAEAILGRTAGSGGWALFYGVFVVAAAVHGAIGLRTVAREWTRLPARAIDAGALIMALGLALLGWRGVWAVTFGAGGVAA